MSDISIRKRILKNGTATYQYSFESAPINGRRKRISKSGFKSKTEALKAGRAALNDYENTGQIYARDSQMSVSDYLAYWLEEDVAHTCKDVTVKNYEKKIRLYINPFLGRKRLKSITKQDIRLFLEDMYDRGFSQNTISVCKSILTKSFDYAVDMQFLPYSPALGIKQLKKGGRPPKTQTRTSPHIYIPKERMDQIFKRFPEGTANHMALMLGYHCSLRLGETFGIVWDDIDLKKGLLKINRQVQWKNDTSRTDREKALTNGTNDSGNGYWYFAEPKYGSYRIVDLDDIMIKLLKREKERQEHSRNYYGDHYTRYFVQNPLLVSGQKPNSQPPVNPIAETGPIEIHLLNVREDGSYITPRTMQHTSSVIHKKLEYKEFDYHSLRHTHATMLTEQGAPLVYIQRRLGHSKLDVTANIYTNHLTNALLKQGNEIINDMF